MLMLNMNVVASDPMSIQRLSRNRTLSEILAV